MRNNLLAMDSAKFQAAVKAGHAAAILRELEAYGIVFDSRLGKQNFLNAPAEEIRLRIAQDGALACDAQPELVTVSNAGIPAFLTNYVDPELIKVLVSPMNATNILSEVKKGDWTTLTATFPVIENEGEVSSYGDYNSNGSVEVNTNFPQRQSYHYQTFTQWGERELAMAALAKIDWASQLNIASVLLLQKFQNRSYFFGVDNLQNYGLLNDPALYAPIAPTAPWQDPTTTAEQVYDDVRRLFTQAQTQSNGTINAKMAMTLALSPVAVTAFNKTNQFNVNVEDQIKKNFPAMRIETAVEYNTEAGELVQLIVDSIEGQKTAFCAFTEKLRAHNMVVDTSSYKQKKSQGTFGTVIVRPFGIASMIGV